MPEQTVDYVISGGVAGKDRLNVLSEALYPFTSGLLDSLGVREMNAFLDCGCGGGNVSLMVAGMLAPGGRVTGVDMDREILELAAADARAKNMDNVTFIHKGVYDLDFNREFDFAYARFLLSHLGDPFAALEKMKEAVIPGGRVVAEDVHFSGHFSYPLNRAFEKYLELYEAVVRKRGGDAEMGPKLPGLFRKAGLKNVAFDVVQPSFSNGNGKWMAFITLDKIKDAIIKERFATEAEIAELLDQLNVFTQDPDSIISLPRIIRVWGDV